MNFREQIITKCIKQCYNELVGGQINRTYDYAKGTEDYEGAVKFLNDTNQIKSQVYDMVMHTETIEFGYSLIGVTKDIRFMGKQKIENMVNNYIDKHLPIDLKEINA